MSHHHHHHHHHGTNNLRLVFFLNLLFTIIEVVGGWYTNSVAIFSDALHDMGDTLALGLAWYLQYYSQKDRDNYYSYGYGRFSVLGSIITSMVLIVGSIMIIQESIPRLVDPVTPHTEGMIWLAVLGILVNGAAVFTLKDSTGLNEKTAMLHLLEDVFGWIIVMIGAIVMKFYHVPFIDPVLSLILAAIILIGVYKNLKAAFKIIMQAIPENVDIEKLTNIIKLEDGVAEVVDMHVWTTDGEYHVMTVNIIIEDADTNRMNDIRKRIKKVMHDNSIEHVTVEARTRE